MELFPVYSVAKTFTAAAIVDLGFDLDSLVQDRLRLPSELPPLTLRDLLMHRSGLPDYGGWREYRGAILLDPPWSFEELLDRTVRVPFGERGRFNYSNVGYAILRRLLEEATGLPFFEALAERVFARLGMTACYPLTVPADFDRCAPSRSSIEGYHPGWVLTGTFVSSVESLVTGYRALLSGALVDPTSLLATLPVDVQRHPFVEPGYAVGLMTNGMPPGYAGHGGAGPGYTIFALAKADGSAGHVEFVSDEVDDAPLIRRCLDALG